MIHHCTHFFFILFYLLMKRYENSQVTRRRIQMRIENDLVFFFYQQKNLTDWLRLRFRFNEIKKKKLCQIHQMFYDFWLIYIRFSSMFTFFLFFVFLAQRQWIKHFIFCCVFYSRGDTLLEFLFFFFCRNLCYVFQVLFNVCTRVWLFERLFTFRTYLTTFFFLFLWVLRMLLYMNFSSFFFSLWQPDVE